MEFKVEIGAKHRAQMNLKILVALFDFSGVKSGSNDLVGVVGDAPNLISARHILQCGGI